jgi:Fe2+ or Zn2+ uptake regulation protein
MRSNKPFIYNPAQKGRDQFSEEYVLRKNLYDRLLQDIADAPMDIAPQHYLVSGQRGMGKTTFLLRLKYAIEDSPVLSQWIIPIRFSEEQYSITRLEHLWEETATLLESESSQYEGLYERILANENADRYDAISFEILESELKQNGHRILLLVDNIGDLFDKFPDIQNHLLRQILMASPAIQLIGCSSRMLEHTFRYDKPFFEFFHQLKLAPLDSKSAIELLTALGKEYHQQEAIENIIEKTPARIEVLRRLTGGVPRTMVLLFNIFIDNANGTAFDDLQHLLDEVNSLYKHRMDELKPQQQQIIDTLAKTWEPMTAKEVLVKSKLAREDIKSNQISAQLKQLADNQIVESIETKGRTQSYRIRERFFNIWYLMRHGRKKNKEEVLWLVRFLEDWCTKSQLKTITKKHILGMKDLEYSESGAYYKARALAEIKGIDEGLRIELLEVTASFLTEKGLLDRASTIKECLAELIPKFIHDKANEFFLKEDWVHFMNWLSELTEKYKLPEETLGACCKLIGLFIQWRSKDFKQSEIFYLKAIGFGHFEAHLHLAKLYHFEYGIFDLAEQHYRAAIDKGIIQAISDLAVFYLTIENEDEQMAEKYALMSLDKDPDNFWALRCLLRIYALAEESAGLISTSIKLLNNADTYKTSDHYPVILNVMLDIGQYQILLSLFKEENSLVMTHALPYYYALAYFIPDDLPGVYANTGSELKETVDEIINGIEARRDESALNKAV